MKRYNTFNKIHKGIRALMYDTALFLQQCDFNNRSEAEMACTGVERVLSVCAEHAFHEEQFVLAAIEKENPELCDEIECEHQAGKHITKRIKEYLLAIQECNNNPKAPASEKLCRSFNDFIAFSLYHMNKEEEQVNKILWSLYTDEEIMAFELAAINCLSPEKLEFFSKWIMRGLADCEIIEWLKEIRNGSRQSCFQPLLNIAQKELPEHRWLKIESELMDGVMIDNLVIS